MNSTTDLRLKVLSKIYCSCTHNFYKVWRYSSEFPITHQNYHTRSTASKSWAFLGAALDDNYLKQTELAWEMTLFLSEDNSTGLNTCPLIPSNLRACKLALRRSCEATGLSWHDFKANKNRSRKILQSTPREKEVFPSQLPPTQIFLRLHQAFLPHERS